MLPILIWALIQNTAIQSTKQNMKKKKQENLKYLNNWLYSNTCQQHTAQGIGPP